jgi:ComF family protein
LAFLKPLAARFFNLIFPDDCRLCEQPLTNVSRVPVCPACLALPKPLQAEFFCRACRTPFADDYPLDEHDLCTVCREGLANFDAAYSFGSYEASLQQLVHLFKYAKVESLAHPLSRFLLQALPLDANFDLVMAMPMHGRKRWQRGFNQAELLAHPVARRYGMPLAKALRRTRYTKSQAGLTETERRANLRGSFKVDHPERIAGKRILLIDDVFTTGSTLRAAAAVLKAEGAAHVSALTLARVDRAISNRTALKSAAAAWGQMPSVRPVAEPSVAGVSQRSPLADE